MSRLKISRTLTWFVAAHAIAVVALADRWPGPMFASAGIAALVLFIPAVTINFRLNRRPGTRFAVDEQDRIFRTPRSIGSPLMGLAGVEMLGGAAAFTVASPHELENILTGGVATAAMAAVLVGGHRALWHGSGLTLRPSGIYAEGNSGTLTIPWEALTGRRPEHPDPFKITVGYRRPELVVSTGWVRRRDTVIFEGMDTSYLASVIQYYATEPGHRHAIGTAAENDRLHAELPVVEKKAKSDPLTKREAAGRILAGVVVFCGTVALDTIWHDSHPILRHFLILPSTLAFGLVASGIRGRLAQRRIDRAQAMLVGRDGTSRPAGPPGGS